MKREKMYVLAAVSSLLIMSVIVQCLLLHQTGYSRKPDADISFPDAGIWCCSERGITLYIDEGFCVIDKDNTAIRCSYTREYGMKSIYINCNEFDNLEYEFAHLFFSGDVLAIYEDIMYIEEHKTNVVYSFLRIS